MSVTREQIRFARHFMRAATTMTLLILFGPEPVAPMIGIRLWWKLFRSYLVLECLYFVSHFLPRPTDGPPRPQ